MCVIPTSSLHVHHAADHDEIPGKTLDNEESQLIINAQQSQTKVPKKQALKLWEPAQHHQELFTKENAI